MMIMLAVAAGGLVLGFVAGRLFPRTPVPTVIEVHNDSGAGVKRVEIVAAKAALAAGESAAFRYPVHGEGGYDLRVSFADGQVREQSDIYVQAGLRQTVRVGQDRRISIE